MSLGQLDRSAGADPRLAIRRAALLASALAPVPEPLPRWRVLKFGGSSVATAERLATVVALAAARAARARVVVVVSALAGITDRLDSLLTRAVQGDAGLGNALHAVKLRHLDLLDAVAPAAPLAGAEIAAEIDALARGLAAVRAARAADAIQRAALLASGERLAAIIAAAAIEAAGLAVRRVESSALLAATGFALDAELDPAASARRATATLAGERRLVVATGFFAGDAEGRPLLLGRGGSDTVATALGEALEAEAVEIWTDVDGVASADPRLVPEAEVLPSLSYDEAALLARHGARVLHAKSLAPVARAAIPLEVRNTLNPAAPGTRIGPGAARADRPLLAAAVGDGESTVAVVAAAAGDATLGARIDATLAAHAIRPRARTVEHGAILLRLPAAAGAPALRALHRALARRAPRVDVVLVGARGQVARALRRQWQREQHGLEARAGVTLRLIAAFDTRGFAADADGLEPATLETRLAPRATGDWDALRERLLVGSGAPTVLVDCTASDAIAAEYRALLGAGVGIVTPNKRANAGAYESWLALRAAAAVRGVPYRYETTVGAALPVLGTLAELVRRGERVTRIEGVLSGSLSFVLGRLADGAPFSAALAEAAQLGYTEPDPREDLEARDLQRKALILAREAGFPLEPAAVEIEPLVGPDWIAGRPDAALDAHWAARAAAAAAAGARLTALVEIEPDRAAIAVRALPAASALAGLAPGENLVRVYTEHHASLPIAVAGPGAGAAVTASGVLGDLLAAARELAGVRG